MKNGVATCCILIASLFFSGCLHSVRLPDAAESEAIRAGDKTIVLLRHQSRYDSKPRETLGTYPMEGFGFEMACLDDGKPLAPVFFSTSPSEQARKDGWMVLVLKPGSYYLSLARAGADQNPAATLRLAQLGRWGHLAEKTMDLDRTYWFHVPRGSGTVYIGSFSNSCKTGRGLFGNLIDQCTEVTVRDETETARSIASAHLNEYGPLRISLVKEYSPALEIPRAKLLGYRWSGSAYDAQIDPAYLGELAADVTLPSAGGATLLPMGFAAAAGREIAFPEWRKRALRNALTMGGLLVELRDFAGDPWGATGAAYLVFYAPPAALFGAVSGEWADKKWKPCAERLVREMSEAQPLKLAGEALLSAAAQDAGKLYPATGTEEELISDAARDRLHSVLKLEVTRVSLQECEAGDSFSLDMAFRWRLWDTASRALLQERVFNYSNPSGRIANAGFYTSRPWEFFLPEPPACRPMEQLCTEEGYAVFRQEMEKGIRETVRRILRQ